MLGPPELACMPVLARYCSDRGIPPEHGCYYAEQIRLGVRPSLARNLDPGAADKAMRASSLAGNPIESHSKDPGDAACPAKCLICQESDRTQQITTRCSVTHQPLVGHHSDRYGSAPCSREDATVLVRLGAACAGRRETGRA